MKNVATPFVFMRNEEGENGSMVLIFAEIDFVQCNWRRSLKMYSQVSQITDKILTTRKSRFIFVTLTVKNPDAEHLTETLDLMNKGFSYITSNSRTFAPAQKFKESCRAISRLLKSHITAKKIHITRIFIAFFKSEQVILQKAILKI